MKHQQGAWTKDCLKTFYPLYSSSSSPFSSSSLSSPPTTSHSDSTHHISPSKYTYQKITDRINKITIYYNNSPYQLQKHHREPSNHSKQLHAYLSSSESSSSSSILSMIKPTTYYDYTISTDHYPPSKPKPILSPILQSLSPSTLPTPSPTTVPKLTLSSTSISSKDDDSYICTKAERQLNVPFDDHIATVKEENHSRILFQNVNSLEISTEQLTLENTCDGINSYEIDIACLAETNTHWKHPRDASILRQTSKRH